MKDVNVVWVRSGNLVTQANVEGIDISYIDDEGIEQFIESEQFDEYFEELDLDDYATKMFSEFIIRNRTEDGIEELVGKKFDYIVRDNQGNMYPLTEVVFQNLYEQPKVKFEDEELWS